MTTMTAVGCSPPKTGNTVEFLHDGYKNKIVQKKYPYFYKMDGQAGFSMNTPESSYNTWYRVEWSTYDNKKVQVISYA